MIELLDHKTGCTNMIKVKFVRKTGFFDITNNSSESIICNKDEALGIVDIRSIGYYKVKQSTIQHNLNH